MASNAPKASSSFSDTDTISQRTPAHQSALPNDGPAAGHKFSTGILNAGFVFALVLASACLLTSSLYLYTFLSETMHKIDGLLSRAGSPGVTEVLIQLGINAALVSARLALLSCGVFVAMAFGFLGFGLFLIGVKGEIEASGTTETFGIKVARMSPGLFVMTGTLVLVGVCVTHRTPFDYRMEQPAPSQASGEKAAESVLKRLAGSGVNDRSNLATRRIESPTTPPTTPPTAPPTRPHPSAPPGSGTTPTSKPDPAPLHSEYDDQLPLPR